MANDVMIREVGEEKLELIKKTVAKGTTDLELELFLHACKRTGLDPLMKQIYAIKRRNNKTGQEDMSIQTGIDGYRLIADRTGHYAGSDEPQYMIAEDGWPDVATVTVYKMIGGQRCPFGASARWKEYCQESSPMWKKMPFLMLGKCAEALALRKAFPAELSGVYTHEEMMQADSEPTRAEVVITNKQTAQAKINELRQEPARQDGGVLGGQPPIVDPQQGPDAAAPCTWTVPKVAWTKQNAGKRPDELDDASLSFFINYYETKLGKEPQSRYRLEWDEALRALVAEAMQREQAALPMGEA